MNVITLIQQFLVGDKAPVLAAKIAAGAKPVKAATQLGADPRLAELLATLQLATTAAEIDHAYTFAQSCMHGQSVGYFYQSLGMQCLWSHNFRVLVNPAALNGEFFCRSAYGFAAEKVMSILETSGMFAENCRFSEFQGDAGAMKSMTRTVVSYEIVESATKAFCYDKIQRVVTESVQERPYLDFGITGLEGTRPVTRVVEVGVEYTEEQWMEFFLDDSNVQIPYRVYKRLDRIRTLKFQQEKVAEILGGVGMEEATYQQLQTIKEMAKDMWYVGQESLFTIDLEEQVEKLLAEKYPTVTTP
jgi:hypothetical protein